MISHAMESHTLGLIRLDKTQTSCATHFLRNYLFNFRFCSRHKFAFAFARLLLFRFRTYLMLIQRSDLSTTASNALAHNSRRVESCTFFARPVRMVTRERDFRYAVSESAKAFPYNDQFIFIESKYQFQSLKTMVCQIYFHHLWYKTLKTRRLFS
jgi:hypothetical protein